MVIPILTYRVHGQLNLSMSIKLYFSSANSKFLLVSNYFLSLIFSITYPSRHYHSLGGWSYGERGTDGVGQNFLADHFLPSSWDYRKSAKPPLKTAPVGKTDGFR